MQVVYRYITRLSPTFLVLIINLSIYLPLAILQRPLWDGALSSYARTGSYKYLNLEAIDYSFPAQYFHEIIINWISLKTHINFYIYYWIAVCITLSLIYKSLQIFSILCDFNSLESVKKNKKSALIFTFFPAFHVLFSTQNFIWVICLAFCLWGTIFLFSPSYQVKVLGLVFIMFSFQMASLPFLFLTLLSAAFINEKSKHFLKVFVITSVFCLFYLVIFRRFLFYPAGIYENYNSIVLSFETVPSLLQNSSNFIFFIVPLIFFCTLAVYADINVKMISFIFKSNKKITILFISMFVSSIFPYVLAQKSPSRLDLFDWSYRHAIITIVPLILYIFWVSERLNKPPNRSILLNFSLFFSPLLICSILATYGHVQSMVFDRALIQALSNSKVAWDKSDLLCFTFSDARFNSPRFYELNEVVWQVTANNKIQSDSSRDCALGEIMDLRYFSNLSVLEISQSKWQNIYIGGLNSEVKQKLNVTGKIGFKEVYRGVVLSDFEPLSISFFDLNREFK